ncbi:MAG: lamin tail domain-containing protein, partial [Planctomycetes bacterium]|nr:lamin tail domain-containing protein [Planctomycetota bacterium]
LRQGQLSVIISEFAAINRGGGALLDEDNDSPDWIEIHNITDATISLKGWYLTDRSDDLNRWRFPEIIMTPDSYRLVFASGKNRRDPESELHTNFSLSADGGYLALVRPDGSTIAWAYDDYPQQYGGVSFGVSDSAAGSSTETILVPEDTPAAALIPTDGSLGLSWTVSNFDDSAWLSGQTAVGYDYGSYINLDVSAMRNNVESVYIRVPFEVDDVAAINELTLRMKYDDAFVAYINGTFVARSANSPELADLAWDSGATANRDDGDAQIYEEFDITLHKGALVQGQNMLAIHGLNWKTSSSDLLMLPELKSTDTDSFDIESLITGYFLSPTPRLINSTSIASPGPWIDQVTDNPPRPSDNEDLTITARVEQTLAPVDTVTLHYRVMYGGTVNLEMFDDGLHNDGDAGDDLYAATIPANAADPGEMVRWYVTATDDQAQTSRNPLFPYSTNSAEYFGAVIADPSTSSLLPVIEWFTDNVSGSEGGGARASVYYDGRFYDNILMHNRGGSTTSVSTTSGANKVHLKFNFNTGQKFKYDPDNPSVNEFNLNHTYSDKSYLRQPLAFEYYDRVGCPGSESFLVRAHRNGRFHAVMAFIEEPEEEMLEREGLDPRGALYKMYNQFTSPSGEKKTRQWEGSSDLSVFMNGMNQTGAARHNYIFDAVDMPRMISYLVGTVIVHQNDHPHKNHYLYRDSEGSGEWFFMPWDHDLTWGSNWTGSSYHDYIYAADDQVGRGTSVKPSHPFVGKEDCQEWNYHWNRLTDKLLNDMTFREMYLRRLRTVMDDILKAPGTPYSELVIEKRIDEIIAQARPDIEEDFLKWVSPGWNWGGQGGYSRYQSLDDAINILKSDYLGVRRTHLFVTHNIDNAGVYPIAGSYSALIPNAQPDPITIQIGQIDYNPISYNQDHEFIELHNPNAIAVDISGWKLTEAVEHTFLPGTVIPAGQSMYVSPNAAAFRTRIANPTGGQGHFVQGNYKGHLSSWGETIVLLDRSDRQVDSLTYQGSPGNAQRYLRISEIMYHPTEDPQYDAGQYEYIELKNIGPVPLETAGLEFTKGITYSFGSSGDPDITELVSITNAWKYEDSGTDLGTEWRQPDYIEGPTWSQGEALFFVEQAAMPEPKNTPVTPGLITYYFRTHFFLEADPDVDNINLWVRTIIDDGAVIYINGDEAMRLGMPDGDVSYSTLTDRSVNDAQYEGPFVIPTTSLVQGDNVIAVEVHQVAANNIDVVFGLMLSATINTVGGSITMNPGEYVLLAKNPALLSSRYENIPTGTTILGPYLGQLSNGGETVKLEDMTNSTIIEFDYNDNWFDITDGYGFSLTIKDVDNPDLNSWDSKSGWWPSAEIGGSPGEDDPDTTLDPDSIVISEVMTHTDDLVYGDWIEIWNKTGTPVYIGGWFLSDNETNLMKYEIAAGD